MEVEQRFDRVIAGLQERKKQVMRTITTNTAPRHQELLSQQAQLSETARIMRSGCEVTRHSLEQSKDVEVLLNIDGDNVEEDHIRVLTGNGSTAVKNMIFGLRELRDQDMQLQQVDDTPLFFVPTHDELESRSRSSGASPMM